jgi:regulator of cell morphogenesis and NO signaling
MSVLNGASIVGELVAQSPGLSRLFEHLGIDYCCGGKRTLEEACQDKHLELEAIVVQIRSAMDGLAPAPDDVSELSLTQLTYHIEQTHHAYLKRELPRLQALVEKIAARHSDKNPKLPQLPAVYSVFRSELEAHMAKEEQLLFPLIRKIDSTMEDGAYACGSIENPIRIMEIEHQHAGNGLLSMRRITNDFTTPPGACTTYRATMHALAELEADMHQHVHKENNVLFPSATAAAPRSPTDRDKEISTAQ